MFRKLFLFVLTVSILALSTSVILARPVNANVETQENYSNVAPDAEIASTNQSVSSSMNYQTRMRVTAVYLLAMFALRYLGPLLVMLLLAYMASRWSERLADADAAAQQRYS